MSWNERDLHKWMRANITPRRLAGAYGSDAAALRPSRGRTVICVDQTVEGVHFERGTDPTRAGRKAANRALSDLAASAAKPRALLLALGLSLELDTAYVRAVVRAVQARARDFGAELVGGDLCAAPGPTSMCVTAVGEGAATRPPPGRERARAGQVVLLTGPTGGSQAERHLAIEPRVKDGLWLHARGATAMMDVSDGLAIDLLRMAEASRVRIELEQIPVHPDAHAAARKSGRSPEWHALHDGEDHELIATMSVGHARASLSSARSRGVRLIAVGRVRAGRGLYLWSTARRWTRWKENGGWVHGG